MTWLRSDGKRFRVAMPINQGRTGQGQDLVFSSSSYLITYGFIIATIHTLV